MDFNNMLDKTRKLTDTTSEAASKFLDEFNAALPTIKALGFSVQDVRMSMGILPEIHAKLIAAAADIDVKTLDELIQKKSAQKTLVAVLKGLQTAYNVRDQLGDLGLSGVEIDLKLGLPPSIGIGFFKPAAVLAPAIATAGIA
jgi:predicted regulator of amino acid metabolism with ACT domain